MTAKRTTNSVAALAFAATAAAAFATQQLQTTMLKERENICTYIQKKKKSQTICESKQIMPVGWLHIELGGTL